MLGSEFYFVIVNRNRKLVSLFEKYKTVYVFIT